MHAGFLGLRQRHLHDFLGDALDLDVHLQRGDAVGRAGHLEVHVAEVVLVTQDVGQDGKAVGFLDQAHCDAGDMRLQRHAGVHQRQAAAADGCHRRRSIRFGDLGHDTHRVGELFLARQHGNQRALGQAAVADLAALGAAHAAHLAGGKGRHVVVQHEAVFVLAGQGVDALGIAFGAQSGHDERLGFTAGEQRRAVGARQHAVADFDGAHGAGVTAIDARLAGQDLAADNTGLDVEQHALDLDAVERHTGLLQVGHHHGVGLAAGVRAALLVADLVGGAQLLFGQSGDLGDQFFVLGRRMPVPDRLARVTNEFMDGIDRDVALLVAEHDRTQHDFFRQLLSLGLHHQHGRFGAGHDQIQLTTLASGLARVQHVLTVDVADASGADGPSKRNAGDGQRGARRDQRGDVGVHLRVQRNGVNHHVHLVEKALGEQWADGAVDQAAGQGFVLARLGLALEETTGDLAGGIGLLDVIDGQRKEVLAGLGALGRHDGRQHDGVVNVDQHGAGGLASDLAGFHDDGLVAPLEGFGDFVENGHVQLLRSAAHEAVPGARSRTIRTRCHSMKDRQSFME